MPCKNDQFHVVLLPQRRERCGASQTNPTDIFVFFRWVRDENILAPPTKNWSMFICRKIQECGKLVSILFRFNQDICYEIKMKFFQRLKVTNSELLRIDMINFIGVFTFQQQSKLRSFLLLPLQNTYQCTFWCTLTSLLQCTLQVSSTIEVNPFIQGV